MVMFEVHGDDGVRYGRCQSGAEEIGGFGGEVGVRAASK